MSNRQLAIAKDRDGAQGPLTPFALKKVDLGVDDDGQVWCSLVAVVEGVAATAAFSWPKHLSVFKQAVLEALISSGRDESNRGPMPRWSRWSRPRRSKRFSANLTHVENKKAGPDENRREAIRKQFSRKLIDAQERKLIGATVRGWRTHKNLAARRCRKAPGHEIQSLGN